MFLEHRYQADFPVYLETLHKVSGNTAAQKGARVFVSVRSYLFLQE